MQTDIQTRSSQYFASLLQGRSNNDAACTTRCADDGKIWRGRVLRNYHGLPDIPLCVHVFLVWSVSLKGCRTYGVLVPCHTCDFVARQSRASKSRVKVARQNRRCDMALITQLAHVITAVCNFTVLHCNV